MTKNLSRSPWRGLLALTIAMLLAVAVVAGVDGWRERSALQAKLTRGGQLFDGQEPLAGILAGHAAPMPAGAMRCSQCHMGPGPASPVAITAQPLGPILDRAHLQATLSRRNGPPTAYDLPGFCRALRIGIDPAHVTLPRVMPRFEIDDARCDALWTYLTQEPT
ncbi:hypothetical protein [Variovorax sp. PAMC 28711]|uniref:hypothetical protein n=1 Tax=Variovorax sp. PAMC 28711 TaxID=1795631 RepID=UPI00078BB40F|nr:hypothetical protein [Variovorax sp. PAMC 28711]AMM24984.1 hypothetical protein AX767_11890 [Variovorax sp. PAMC 28711]